MVTGAYHISRRRTQKLLRELIGITVSLGAVIAMERRASDALKSVYDEAPLEVQYARSTHSTSFMTSGCRHIPWPSLGQACSASPYGPAQYDRILR